MKTALVIPILAVLLCGCAARKVVPPGTIPPPVIPSQSDSQIAESFVHGHANEEGYTLLSSKSKQTVRVRGLLNKVFVAAGYQPNALPVHVVDAGEEVNAMAVNGASIVVYKALLDKVPNDNDLAVVLAHEVAHILAQHAHDKGKEERATWVSVGSTVLGTVASVATSAAGYSGASGLAGDLTETTTGFVGYGAIVQKFDRDQEYEADHIGLMLMAKAGYDPEAAPKFWERAKEIFGADSSTLGAFLSTHPASADRVEALREVMPLALNYYQAAQPSGKKKA